MLQEAYLRIEFCLEEEAAAGGEELSAGSQQCCFTRLCDGTRHVLPVPVSEIVLVVWIAMQKNPSRRSLITTVWWYCLGGNQLS